MASSDTPPIERDTLRQVYDRIASGEAVDREPLAEAAIDGPAGELEEGLDTLIEEGYLGEDDGQLEIGIPGDAAGTFESGDVSYTIRVARQADFPEIKSVIEEVAAERTYIEAETVAEELGRDDTLMRFDGEKTRVFFVAEVGDEIVGWLHIEAPEREKLKYTARFTVGVVDRFRGNGIGKQLMTSGLEWAEAHGYHKVYNNFPATNREALAFLDSLDYDAHCEAVHRNHYLVDGEFVDQMSLAVNLHDSLDRLTHFDRVEQEAEEVY